MSDHASVTPGFTLLDIFNLESLQIATTLHFT